MKKILPIALAGLIVAPILSVQGAHAATNTPCQSQKQSASNVHSFSVNQDWVNSILKKYGIKPGQWQTIQQVEKVQASQPTSTKQSTPAKAQTAAPAPKQSTPAKAQSAAPAPKQSTQAPASQQSSSNKASQASSQNQSVNAYEKKVVELTNQERAKQGLKALTLSTPLSKMARDKSADMRDKGYFDHQSPTYGSPFDMMNSYGIKYSSAGENIAAGQPDPQAVVDAWMKSPGHRANILNSSYTTIGVGYVKGGSYGSYWTQEFIGK